MRAFVVKGPGECLVESIPDPRPGDDEVLIKVEAAGLCGTDAHILAGDFEAKYPLVPGHEFAGTVVDVGSQVKDFHPGQRVSADPNIFCERCHYCKQNLQNHCLNWEATGVTRQGAMAELVSVPQATVFDVGDLDFRAAAFVEPLACVIYGYQRAGTRLGGRVLIFGAGPIGLLHLQVARHYGAAEVVVVDLRPERLELARKLGASSVVQGHRDDPRAVISQLRELEPHGFSMVVDCTGVAAVVETGVELLDRCGVLLVFGVCSKESTINLRPFDVYRRDLTIVGSFALRKSFAPALSLIRSGAVAVHPLIGAEIGLEEVADALADLQAGRAPMKVMVTRF